MPRQRFTTEEIIHKLREADVWVGQGGLKIGHDRSERPITTFQNRRSRSPGIGTLATNQ